MLMEPDEYTPQERALTDKAKELIEQHELDWGNGECFIQRDAGHSELYMTLEAPNHATVTSVMLLSTALENRTIWYQRVRRVSFVRPMASIQSIHFSMDSFQSSRGSTCSQLFLLSFQYLMGLLKRIEKGSDFFVTSQGILLRVSGRCSSENQLQGEHAR